MTLLRWQQAQGKRHAFKLDTLRPQVDEPFLSLCGSEVTPRRNDFAALGGYWLDPTCMECHAAWLRMNVSSTGVLL